MLPSALNLIAIILLACGLAYMWLVKPPSASSISSSAERRMVLEIKEAKATSSQVVQQVQPKSGPAIRHCGRNACSGFCRALRPLIRSKMGAFRPQRSQGVSNIIEMPFTVQITWQYPAFAPCCTLWMQKAVKWSFARFRSRHPGKPATK